MPPTQIEASKTPELINEVLKNLPALAEGEAKNEHFSPSKEIFILSFKKGHEVIRYHFQEQNLGAAVKTGQDFCSRKKYRFIVVTPLLRDLKKMLESEDF